MDKEEWFKLITTARKIVDGSQEALARIFDVSQQTISNWENGTIPRPNNIRAVVEFVDTYDPLRKAAQNIEGTLADLPLAETESDYSQYSSLQQKPYEEYTAVPKYKAKLSGGPWSLVTSDLSHQIRKKLTLYQEGTVRFSASNPAPPKPTPVHAYLHIPIFYMFLPEFSGLSPFLVELTLDRPLFVLVFLLSWLCCGIRFIA